VIRMRLRILHRLPVFLAVILVMTLSGGAIAQDSTPVKLSALHPTFPMLDVNGENVLDSGEPVSTMETCGACHDTEYIEQHSYHASVGLDHLVPPGHIAGGQPWDISRSLFGRWDPIEYRYLTPEGDELVDMGTADWIELFGKRHVGGGPSVTSRDGATPLLELDAESGSPEVSTHDPVTGETTEWNWQESGIVEMNCFLCHLPSADNEARVQALENGEFQWANTATLLGTGIVDKKITGWKYNLDAFQENGELAE